MRTRTIVPEDLIDALHPYTDGGALERTEADVRALRELFEALLKTLSPAQLLAVYEARFDTRRQYDGGVGDGGVVELTAPGVAR